MTIDGGAGDAELGSDLRNGALTLSVGVGNFIHRPCHFYLARTKFRLPPTCVSSSTGCSETFGCAFGH